MTMTMTRWCNVCLQVLDDWRYIAMVIDRLQLYVFLAVTYSSFDPESVK